MEKKFFAKLPGFTLIEVMTVLAIMGILMASGFIFYQSSRHDAILRGAQREVATAIRMAQGYALQGKSQVDAGGDDFTPCGYGFEFTGKKTYRIFYTKTNDDKLCREVNNYPGTRIDVQGGNFTLSNDVTLTDDNLDSTRFYFKIPFGVILNSAGSENFAGKTITLDYAGNPIAISVSKRGEVEEVDY